MTSLKPSYVSAFADSLAMYDVFSMHRDGRDAVRVISNPERRKNLIGEKSYIIMKVNRLHPHGVGEMILCPSNVVYVKSKRD